MTLATESSRPQRDEFFYFELGLLLVIALTLAVVFANSTVDLMTANWYFHPDNASNFWPEQNEPLWKFFYFAAPAISVVYAVGAVLVLVGSFMRQHLLAYRWKSLFLVLVLAIGPGFLVNSVFKPLWGRPRPRQVVELGGHQQYLPFWQPGKPGDGMSFPCGHCSIGFMMGAFYFVLKDRRRKTAVAILAGSIVLGTTMGFARLADGAHFLSDTAAAALITYLTMFVLYYYIVRVPTRALPTKTNRKRALQFGFGLGAVAIIAPMAGTPFHAEIHQHWTTDAQIVIEMDRADVHVSLNPVAGETDLTCDFKGFGLPRSHLLGNQEGPVWTLQKQGLFTDLEGRCELLLSGNLEYFTLRLRKGGNIQSPSTLPAHYKLFTEKY